MLFYTIEDKIDIIRGLCRGIVSLHNYEPPFYHRNICPEAFYIFNVKGKYKALLAKFDCTKDNSDDAAYTVLSNIEKKVASQKTNKFFAPEVLHTEFGQDVDFLDECEINDDAKCILFEMLSKNPKDRPEIEELMACLTV